MIRNIGYHPHHVCVKLSCRVWQDPWMGWGKVILQYVNLRISLK